MFSFKLWLIISELIHLEACPPYMNMTAVDGSLSAVPLAPQKTIAVKDA